LGRIVGCRLCRGRIPAGTMVEKERIGRAIGAQLDADSTLLAG
jgi:hypothetical protein